MKLLPKHTRAILADLFRPHVRDVSWTFLLLCLSSLVTLAVPWLLGRFAEVLLDVADLWMAAVVLLQVLAVVFVQSVISYIGAVRLGSIGQQLILELRGELFEHLQGLPMLSVQPFSTGSLLNRFTDDADTVTGFLFNVALNLLPQLLMFLGAAVLIAWIDPVIAVGALLGIPVIAAAGSLATRRIRADASELISRAGDAIGRVEEGINQLAKIKASVQSAAETRAYRRLNEDINQLYRDILQRQSLLAPMTQFVGLFAVLVMVWLLAARTSNPLANVEELVSLLLYGLLMIRPAAAVLRQYGAWQAVVPALERLEALLSLPREDTTSGGELTLRQPLSIRCAAVTFAYDPAQEPVLDALSFEFEGPGILLVRGGNGSGKSTLLKMFNRLLEPDSGTLFLQGEPIADIKLDSLRRQVGWLAQDAQLLNRSIRDNLTFSGAQPGNAAGRFEKLLDFVDAALMDDTAGERGDELSGGQRQRILICEVLAAAQPLILLDEPSLSLDVAGEEMLRELLRELAPSHTLIIATHDDRLLELADKVIDLA